MPAEYRLCTRAARQEDKLMQAGRRDPPHDPRGQPGGPHTVAGHLILPSPLPIASMSKCYDSYCTTSDVCTTTFLGPSGQAVGLALEATPKAGPAECLRVQEMNLSDDRL